MSDPLTPREIVAELDKHIVGQQAAKRAVAIALRNRWRRMQVVEPLRAEITPKNILMIGPTGVGKTEIARTLAAPAPRGKRVFVARTERRLPTAARPKPGAGKTPLLPPDASRSAPPPSLPRRLLLKKFTISAGASAG